MIETTLYAVCIPGAGIQIQTLDRSTCGAIDKMVGSYCRQVGETNEAIFDRKRREFGWLLVSAKVELTQLDIVD